MPKLFLPNYKSARTQQEIDGLDAPASNEIVSIVDILII